MGALSFLPELPFVVLRNAAGQKPAEEPGYQVEISLSFFKETKKLLQKRAFFFSSTEYPTMSSVQNAGKCFTPSLVLKAAWVLGAFFQALTT